MSKQDINTMRDEKLAEFTDQILAGKTPVASSDPELHDLAEVVRRLDAAFGPGSLDDGAAARVQKRLVTRWPTSAPRRTASQGRGNFANWWQANRRRMKVAIPMVVVLLLLGLVPWLLTANPSIPGTSGTGDVSPFLLAGLGLLLIAALIYGIKTRR